MSHKKPYLVDSIPMSGYNKSTAPMVCLSKCETPFNDGVCYPETFSWPVPTIKSNQIWIASNLYWWGNNFAGKPVLRITVTGDKGSSTHEMIVNAHTAEWNRNVIKPATGVTIHNDVRSSITHESRFHVARFTFDTMKVSNVTVDLINAAPYGKLYGVAAIYGVTLVNNQKIFQVKEPHSNAGIESLTTSGRRVALTKGWDIFNAPLATGSVNWSSRNLNNGNRTFQATFDLKGAEPNHEYTVGVHFFEPKGKQLTPIKKFGGWMVSDSRSTLTRDGQNATLLSAWDFGLLKTDAAGNGDADFSFNIPSSTYYIQFTVRKGTCRPSKGQTSGCAATYRTGGKFGVSFEVIN